jgi:hypothetical protein
MRLIAKVCAAVVIVAAAVAGWNHVSVNGPVAKRLAQTPANEKLNVLAYHQYAVLPSVLVLDLRKVGEDASAADSIRVLLQSAEALKDKKFERVVLAHRGKQKLQLEGDYFKKIGEEFEFQNPVYTMRTLPENVQHLDGSPAYGTWTGGVLGVLGKQMEDLISFAKDWYLQDLIDGAEKK